MQQTIRPIVFCGPSGAGKSTLLKKMMKQYPGEFGFSVSHTTRAPREGEVDGVDYNFTSRTTIDEEIKAGKFIEFAHVHGNTYGTSIDAVKRVSKEGRICILDIDVQGVKSVHKSDLKPLYLFIAPPSLDELKRRLVGRGSESEESLNKRLENAVGEMEYKDSELFDQVVVNDDLEKAYEDLMVIITPEMQARRRITTAL